MGRSSEACSNAGHCITQENWRGQALHSKYSQTGNSVRTGNFVRTGRDRQTGNSVRTGNFVRTGRERRTKDLRETRRRADDQRGAGRTADGALPDYGIYILSVQEILQTVGEYFLLDFAVSMLFYNSWIAFLAFLPGGIFYFRERTRGRQEQRSVRMRREFLDGMQFAGTALQSGYAMENVFSEALTELRKIYEEDAFIVREFSAIAVQTKMNVPVEGLLEDLARRSHIDDIRNFSDVFYTARKTGGDMIAIVRNTTSNMRQKEETLQEIETVIAGKKMEQKIMSVIPLAILAYVRMTDAGFLSGMYHTAAGTCIMTACLAVYLAAFFWGRSIMDIRV